MWSLRHRGRVMDQPTRFVGMAVPMETIVVAVTAAGDCGKATPYGTFPNTAAALDKLVRRLRHAGSGPLKFCYEAGPCGYGRFWAHGTKVSLCRRRHVRFRCRGTREGKQGQGPCPGPAKGGALGTSLFGVCGLGPSSLLPMPR